MKPENLNRISWHSIDSGEALELLKTDQLKGLTSEEVLKRREIFGPNRLTPKKGTPAWLRFLLQFHQPLVYILLAASLITFLLKEYVDSGVIFAVIFVNSIIGYLQESKALKALDALSRSMTTHATVIRDGEEKKLPSSELVPGDIVLISSGDRVPADIRLIKIRDLSTNESALTGESLPVEKKVEKLREETGLADRTNMVYASTFVIFGQGKGVVTAIGDFTEVGKISKLIKEADELETPLTRKIASFSHFLLKAILFLAFLTFIAGIYHGNSFIDMFLAAVALAVGAIPEGLPAAVTITLAIGVSRMARRNAIIRKLPAVETLGSTAVICSDKTGTLTENQMTVKEIYAGGRLYSVSGTGYQQEGVITEKIEVSGGSLDFKDLKNGGISPGKNNEKKFYALEYCLLAGLLCNDSRIVEKKGRNEVEGDPTEGALIISALKASSILGKNLEKIPRIDSIPFESEYQYMATLHGEAGGKAIIFVKGSVEKLLEKCTFELGDDGERRTINHQEILKRAENMASRGLRVLLFAMKEEIKKSSINHGDIENLTFLGLQAMIDPPRKEAIEAVETCRRAGIEVKMITGDHALTALAIGKELGLECLFDREHMEKGQQCRSTRPLEAITGKELEKMSDEELARRVDDISIFARVTPEQKLKIVKAIQARKHVTAMTGDGVNDAPALKQADIGVAMGLSGTEVAKEAADMVLLDDNFATIEAAVEEGRCVFDNLRKFIVWTIPTNLGEALSILVAIFLGLTLPVLPVQILWVNMTTAIFLGLMLAFEPKEPDIMLRPPADPEMPVLTRCLMIRTLYVGFLLVAGIFFLFFYEIGQGSSLAQARTAAVNTLVFGELFYLFNCRSLTRSAFSIGFFSNRLILFGVSAMILLQLAFTYLPFMNTLFHTAPVGMETWMRIIPAALVIYIVVGIEKKIRLLLS